jgi:malonate transporter
MNELENWQFFLGIAIGLLSIYVVSLGLSLVAFRKSTAASSLQALNSSFPNMAFMGVPVLTAVIGKSAVLSVVIGNLVSSFVLLPLTLTLLESGKAAKKGANGAKAGDAMAGDATTASGMAVVWKSLLGAVMQPLVWAPLLGVAIAVLQLPMPEVAIKSLNLIGAATSGVALFALGLVLSGQRLKVGFAAIANTVFKMLAQPAVMLLLAVLLGVTGLYRREMILLGALPTASMTAMFAVQYNVYVAESDATILLSTILSIVTLGICIALTA